jgi:hypothetical protein
VALGAIQQAHSDLFFEIVDLPSQRRLGQVELVCRLGEIQNFGNGHEVAKVTKFHSAPSFWTVLRRHATVINPYFKSITMAFSKYWPSSGRGPRISYAEMAFSGDQSL